MPDSVAHAANHSQLPAHVGVHDLQQLFVPECRPRSGTGLLHFRIPANDIN
jgi:hypothetical protein